MRRCAAKPYEGQEKYVFVSYCHRDKAYVFPVIEQLVKDGYRVWYDEGIDPGSEWPEIIAKHLNGSAICVAFITENSLNSHNCRREINFALLKKKYFISVVLEPVQMSLGMEMQLSSSQSIFKYTLSTEKEFFDKLYEAKELVTCKGIPNHAIEVSLPSDYLSDAGNFDKVRDPFSDRWFAQGNSTAEETARRKAEEEARYAAEEEARRQAEEEARRAAEEEARRQAEEEARHAAVEEARRQAEEEARRAAEEEARRQAEEEARRAAEEEARRQAEEEAKAAQQKVASFHILRREKTGEMINIAKSPFKIGRSNTADDYVITDNRSISRSHATVVVRNDVCYITDNGSLNKTYINGTAIVPETEYALSAGDNVKLYNERFVYLKYQD